MKIEETTVRQIRLSDIMESHQLDPIDITLENFEPGRGRITIRCYRSAWTAYWGSMSNKSVEEFFCSCDEGYIACYLDGSIRETVFDPDGLVDWLKASALKERRQGWTSAEEARILFDKISDTNFPDTVDGLWAMSGTMVELLGDEWWYRLPEKTNPRYAHICRVIRAVQEGLKLLAQAYKEKGNES